MAPPAVNGATGGGGKFALESTQASIFESHFLGKEFLNLGFCETRSFSAPSFGIAFELVRHEQK
jgi:hypothetical protein